LVLPSAVVVVFERFAREFAVFACSRGGLSGQVSVSGCEMADTNELEPAHAPLRLGPRELALRQVAVDEQLLMDVVGARLAQVLEPD